MFVYVVQVPARVVGSQLGFFDEIDSHPTLQTHALIETEPHAHTNYKVCGWIMEPIRCPSNFTSLDTPLHQCTNTMLP